MPIYEYSCSECGKNFEQIRRFSDPPLESCSVCGAANPTKLVSASAFHLKGSGWYATDYGATGGRSGGGVSSKSTGTSEGASSTGTEPSETKADTKKEASSSS